MFFEITRTIALHHFPFVFGGWSCRVRALSLGVVYSERSTWRIFWARIYQCIQCMQDNQYLLYCCTICMVSHHSICFLLFRTILDYSWLQLHRGWRFEDVRGSVHWMFLWYCLTYKHVPWMFLWYHFAWLVNVAINN